MTKLDELDLKILSELQSDSSPSLEELAKRVNSSKTPVWNRIQKLRKSDVILSERAILNADALGLDACFFVLIRTNSHAQDWQQTFLKAVKSRPEVLEAHRLAGDIDYLLKVVVKNAKAYDEFYQSLIGDISIYNVTALLSMEEIKSTTELPI